MVDRLARFEQEMLAAVSDFDYPATPRIANAVMLRLQPQIQPRRLVARRLLWALVVIAVLLAGLISVPPVRAAVLEWLQIGVVRIFIPRRNPEPSLPARPGAVHVTATASLNTGTPPGTTLRFSLLDLAGETSLAQAQSRLDSPILIPSYPPGLGLPDRVYLQDQGGSMLALIWLDPANPDRVRLSLHTLTSGSWAIEKSGARVVRETSVNGQSAVWTEGPYFMKLRNLDFELVRLIDGHVLIWAKDKLTYRLETDLTMEEAIRMAESLVPIPANRP